jgi:Ca-activated chloride channel family protein
MTKAKTWLSMLYVGIGLLMLSSSVAQESSGPVKVILTAESVDSTATDVSWILINSATEDVTTREGGATVELELEPGNYEVLLTAGDFEGESVIEVTAAGNNEFSISTADADEGFAFMAPESIPAGHNLQFEYRGPNLKGDLIFITRPATANNRYFTDKDVSHKAIQGSPAVFVAPSGTGDYELRYFSMANGSVLFRQAITVTDPQITWRVPAEIVAATEFSFAFSGPNLPQDRLFIAKPDMASNRYVTDADRSHKVTAGLTATLIAPVSAGDYEIRYFSGAAGSVLDRYPLVVAPHTIAIEAPRMVDAGTEFEVTWSGPNVAGDFLFVAKPDLEANAYFYGDRQRKTSAGSPVKFTAPAKPGPYEIRYFSKKNGRAAAKRTIVVR